MYQSLRKVRVNFDTFSNEGARGGGRKYSLDLLWCYVSSIEVVG